LPISAVDVIAPTFQHAKQQLFKPFRIGQWVRLALLGLATGELGSAGGCHFNVPSIPHKQPTSDQLALVPAHLPPILRHMSVPEIVLLASLAMLLLTIVMLLFLYLNSICRFILFDSILTRQCSLREGWRKWRATGRRFFIWQLLFQIVVMMGMVILAGLPLGFAYLAGWFREPKQHLAPLILGGILFFFVLLSFLLLVILVHVLAKDFVVPLMALDDLDWRDAWERLWQMLKAEKGGYAGYIGMKVLLAIAASIVIGFIGFFIALILIMPVIIAFLLPTIRGGPGVWNVYTITLAVVVGTVVFMLLMCVMSFISVPMVVFFPAYAIYFFAARYPALSLRLYGAPPPPPLPSTFAPLPA
jgi:hypothetical protein